MDNKKELISNFENFRSGLIYPYGRSYFSDEVSTILYNESFVLYMAQFERNKLSEYAVFDNYTFTLDAKNIDIDEKITLIGIRHYDIYVEYLLTYNFAILKSNVKNIDFENSSEIKKKIFEVDEIIYHKGKLLNSQNLFKIEESNFNIENRKKILGGWSFKNSKYYFKSNNVLVYIIDELVLFGNYYFLGDYIMLYFDNANEFKLPEMLYYEIVITKHEDCVMLKNESYGHLYLLSRI